MAAARPPEPPVEPTRRLPAAERTEKLPRADATQAIPASPTESIPETHPDRPTRAIRQVRRRDPDGAWPAIPMLPVIRPEDPPLSEMERVQEQRGVRALREHLDRWQDDDADAAPWPERRDPPGTIYPPEH